MGIPATKSLSPILEVNVFLCFLTEACVTDTILQYKLLNSPVEQPKSVRLDQTVF